MTTSSEGRTSADLDVRAVEDWLTANVPSFRGPLSATKFPWGQSNPTFRLESPSGRYVLRRKPMGTLLKSAHAVDREFRVQRALQDTAVPVARMFALCEDDAVIGSMFYVMEHVEGRNFDDPRVPEVEREERAAIYDSYNRSLAAIHTVDVEAVGLADFGRPGNYYARQIDRWTKQYRSSQTEDLQAMEELIAWVSGNQPPDDGLLTLVHGDYRMDNMLFAPDRPDCVAVLDWELSTLGHPYADLAAVLMQWRLPTGPRGRGLEGVDREALGIPSDEAFVERYCERTGTPGIDRFNFYIAFSFFRMTAIIQGVKKRGLDGNASNPERAAQVGAVVPMYAQRGLDAAHHG